MPQCKNPYSTAALFLLRQVRFKEKIKQKKKGMSIHMILLWKDLGTHQLSLSNPIFNDFSTVLYCTMLMAVVVIVQLLDMVPRMSRRLKD